jgi:hypothetical protein
MDPQYNRGKKYLLIVQQSDWKLFGYIPVLGYPIFHSAEDYWFSGHQKSHAYLYE